MLAQDQLAEGIARLAHCHQVRAGEPPEPYIEHVARVAGTFGAGDFERRAVAWLHDVIEDTTVQAGDLLAAGVDPRIVEAVELLTHPHRLTVQEYLDHIAELARKRSLPARWAQAVKLADLTDNLGAIERLANVRPRVSGMLAKRYAGAFEILDPDGTLRP